MGFQPRLTLDRQGFGGDGVAFPVAAYDARKLLEAERVATKAHAHARAQRYVEKRLIRSLWREWVRIGG